MPDFSMPPAITQAPDDNNFRSSKCPREQLLLLRVEAAHCPNVFRHILHFVTAAAAVPVDVTLENGAKRLTIEIVLDRTAIDPTCRFLSQIEDIPAVKSAEFLDYRGRVFVAAPDLDAGERIIGGRSVKRMERALARR